MERVEDSKCLGSLFEDGGMEAVIPERMLKARQVTGAHKTKLDIGI